MVRPRRIRRIFHQPNITYFKPAGVPMAHLKEEVISYEEAEAVRLIDLEEKDQKEIAKKMKISQPTLSRLLKSGRKKIANAIIKGQAIKIQGGNFQMAGRGMGRGMGRGRGGGGGGRMGGAGLGPGGTCKCPSCGHTEPQIRGQPCMNKKCPKCGTMMIRA
jgi:predicted DNA-binding protein (UPF0251 family)